MAEWLIMRLSSSQIQIIRDTVIAMLGADVRIVLFGSRLDDAAKGGDIDLMVSTTQPVNRSAFTAALLSAKLSRALDGRQVDVVLQTPQTHATLIHEIAQSKGIVL